MKLLPDDEYNRSLLSQVHPGDHVNPTPSGRYNLVVVGAGTAGLVTAAGAAGLGAKVALVERNLLGGDCLNVGCVPSKALLRSAHVAADARRASEFGVVIRGKVKVDFAKVMERMRAIRAGISPVDGVPRFQNDLGVDVFLGEGRFTAADTLEVGGQKLHFAKAVIATGARPLVPPIPGLEEAGYRTNENVFELTELPARLLVLGGGPIGCELAQAFRRFGSEVHLVETEPQFLRREDPDAAAILLERFRAEGIHVHLETKMTKVDLSNDAKTVTLERGGETSQIEVDEILVGAGRAPNVEGLGLDEIGVEYDTRSGVEVDDRLRTTHPRIYAAGDVCMSHKFTHAAEFAARTVIQNALFFGRKKLSTLTIPWCTYTDPEIAHVGLDLRQARAQGIEIDTFTHALDDTDRAIADGDREGFVKVHVAKGKDRIVGCTIVARNAGDMISEVSTAMAGKMGLGRIAGVIHPYPTQADAIRQTANAYTRTRLTPFVAKLFDKWLAWQR